MKAVHWTQPSASGLGDRLVDLTLLLAYARILERPLYYSWPRFEIKAIDISHRSTDIILDNVKRYIKIPNGVFFKDCRNPDIRFNRSMGGAHNTTTFHVTFLKDTCSFDRYVEVVNQVAKEFRFCDEINNFLATIPKRFVSFHVRRGDKVRNEPTDGNFVHINDIDELNQLTYRALDYYIRKGFDTFFICSDEDNKKAEFSKYIVDKGLKTFSLPPMEKWISTYYDLATMSYSQHIVTSNRYSSFSRFSSMLGNGSCDTVYSLKDRP